MADPTARLAAALADRYRLERELGQGGMAVVHLAEDLRHRRRVAIKVLRPELAVTLGADRFLREIEIAARLQHPHILPVHDSGEAAGFLYYVMPYVEGETLRERLKREPPLPLSDTVRILREVADALAHAHAQGVVHRDIKPENILLSGRHALVADFGVAKAVSDAAGAANLTTAGVALGTPTYMAPEQATADPSTDHRADLYALGAVGYEMLAGRPPFVAATAPLVLAAHLTEAPVPIGERRAGVPAELAEVLMRCLAKAPADRPASADEVLAALETLGVTSGGTTPAATRPLQAATPVSAPQPAVPVRRPRALVAGGIAALLALAAFGAAAKWLRPAGGTTDRPRIVVLPPRFTGPAERAYVAEGIADEVNNRLVSLNTVEVVGRASADRFRNSDKSMREIGEALGAPFILALRVTDEGASAGNTRVTAELLRSATEAQAWSASFTVKGAEDMFALQQQVAERTADAMGVRLAGTARSQLSERPTRDDAAYDAYLRARFVMARSNGATDFERAAELYAQAAGRDSGFARAWSGLGQAHLMVFWFYGDRTADRLARARHAIDRARALAPEDAESHYGLGEYQYRARFDFEGALTELQRALELNPDDADYHAETAYVLRRLGRYEEARRELARALELDPLNVVMLGSLGQTQFLLGDVAGSTATMRGLLAMQPDLWTPLWQLVDIAIASGNRDSAHARAVELFRTLGVPSLVRAIQPLVLEVGAELTPQERAAIAAQITDGVSPDTAVVRFTRATLRTWAGADARDDLLAALPGLEARTRQLPEDVLGWGYLGRCLAALGRYPEALAAARAAVATPTARNDRYEGPMAYLFAAAIAAAAGDEALATEWARVALGSPLASTRLRWSASPDLAKLRAVPGVRKLLQSSK